MYIECYKVRFRNKGKYCLKTCHY